MEQKQKNDDKLLTTFGLQEIRMHRKLELLRIIHQKELFRLASYSLKADKIKSLKEKICPVRNNSTNKLNVKYEDYDFLQMHNFMTEGKRDQKNELYELKKAKALEELTKEKKRGTKKKKKDQKWKEERILRNLQRSSVDCALSRKKTLYGSETKDIIYYKNRKCINNKKLEIDAKKKKKAQEKEDDIKKAKEKEELEQIEKSNYYYNIDFDPSKFNEKWIALEKNKKIQYNRFENERKDKILELRRVLEEGDIEKKTKIQNIAKVLPQDMDYLPKEQLEGEMEDKNELDNDMIILLKVKGERLRRIRDKQEKEAKLKKKKEEIEKRRKEIEKENEIEKEKEKQKIQYTVSSELEIIEAVQKYKSKRYDIFLEKVKEEKMKEKERAEKLAEEKDEERKMELEKKFQEERGRVAKDLKSEYNQIEDDAKCYEEELREELEKKNNDGAN